MTFIGLSQDTDPGKAGREAADIASSQLPTGGSASWALAFCGGRHDPGAVLSGMVEVLGDVPIYGGSAAGLMTNTALGYTGYESGLILFSDEAPNHGRVSADLRSGEHEAGREIGLGLRDGAVDGDSVLIFYDNLRSSPPPVLYAGSKLMDGIYDGLGDRDLQIFGAGLVGDFTFSPTFLFDGKEVSRHSTVAIILPRNLTPHTTIMHGCTPISSFLEITKMDGPILYELEGRRATDIFSEMLGVESGSPQEADIPFLITLGHKYGDPFAPFSEEQYVNRLIISSNPEDGSVMLFEDDFTEGMKVQIMSRDNSVMADSVWKQTSRLLNMLEGEPTELAFYIDCAGRASCFSGSEVEEAGVVRELIGDRMPFLGFYSGIEIAPFLGRSRPLDWTGVLTVFTRK